MPTCGAVLTGASPAQTVMPIPDDDGVVSIVVTQSENADTVVPPCTPSTTPTTEVTSTKIDQTQIARVELLFTDSLGNVRVCEIQF